MIEIKGEIKIQTKTSTLYFDIKVNKGDVSLIIGSNGSGKTTLFDIITGNRNLDKGVLKVDSKKPIAYALQDIDNCLLPWLSIIENIQLPNKLFTFNDFDNDKVYKTLQKFNLFHRKDDYPYKLSGGEKQIINFIRTIYSPSEILLFDEVFSSMHSDTKKIAKEIFKEEMNDKTILFVTHDSADLTLIHNREFAFLDNSLVEIDNEHAKEILNQI
jgi:ABC-type nitrate/sulfonate/bicarbonate transport system ATPase subunit